MYDVCKKLYNVVIVLNKHEHFILLTTAMAVGYFLLDSNPPTPHELAS